MTQKEKAYDKAIEIAKNIYGASECKDILCTLETIFPELKESEGDKSKKWILEYLYDGLRKSDEQFKGQFKAAISWLEKQGEQTADKVKFKVGDWVVIDGEALRIKEVTKDGYLTDESGLIPFRCDREAHLWTIQDAKDGDVLALERDKKPFIFKGFDNPKCPIAYCGIGDIGMFKVTSDDGLWTDEKVEPATLEQRDFLFQKMKENGYEWDAENKELTKIEQKPAWSEEDELMFTSTIQSLKLTNGACDMKIDWLKSLKDRVQPKPKQEWSEEDEIGLTNTIIMLKEGASLHFNKKDITKAVDWLKSLRPTG